MILGLRQAAGEVDVLGCLHEHLHALDVLQVLVQAPNHLVRSEIALRGGLEQDEQPAVVFGDRWAAWPDIAGGVRHGRILGNKIDHIALEACHSRRRDILCRFGDAHDHPSVLLREKALGNYDEQRNSRRDARQHDGHRRCLISQREPEPPFVSGLQRDEAVFQPP